MNIGNVNVGNIFSGMGPAANIMTTFIYSMIGFVIVLTIAGFGWRWWRNKTLYNTPVSLTILMDNGVEKTRHDLMGGVFWNRGIKDFKVKAPRTVKKQILGYVPDFSKTNDLNGRLHFITSGDAMIWQQVSHKWVLKKEVEGEPILDEKGEPIKVKDEEGNEIELKQIYEYDLIQEPVPRETKQITVNSIKYWRETIDKSKLTAWSIAIGAFVILSIVHLVSLFIQTKIRCGGA